MLYKFNMIIAYFLFSISFIAAAPRQCNDIDLILCYHILNKLPEACGDPCLAKYCKRSCKICPLECFDCPDITDVSSCSTVTTCQDPTDYCFTAQIFTAHFTETYRMGCGNRQTCQQYSNGHHNRASLEAGCCNTDRCNNKPPPILKLEPTKNVTEIAPMKNHSVCKNRDDGVCQRLALISRNPCSDDCVASKLCPRMCRKCFDCLDCYEVDSPDNCTKTTACGYGTECYGLEKLGSNFKQVVQLGCIDQKLCEQLSTSSGHIFGKRDFHFNGQCCTGDRCNAHPVSSLGKSTIIPQITTQHKTTHCPSQFTDCPDGFDFYVYSQYMGNLPRQCYKLGRQKMTKKQAEAYCKDHCADLFYIEPSSTNLFEVNALSIFTNTTAEAFIGMERIGGGFWTWSHDHLLIPHQIESYISSPDAHDCVIAKYEYNPWRHESTDSLQSVECNAVYKPFCKINLQ